MTTWLRVDQALFDHRKTVALEAALGVEHGWRFVVYLWSWCLDNRERGVIGHVPAALVARAAHWRGDPELFVRALVEAGFLRNEPEAGLVVHDWMAHQGKLIRDRERKRAAKAEADSAETARNVRGSSEPIPQPTGNGKRNTIAASETPAAAKGGKSRKRATPPDPNVKKLIDHYHAEYQRTRGVAPVIRGGAAGDSFKTLLTGRSLAEAQWVVTEYLERPPQWYADRGLFNPEHIVKAANTLLARRHEQ